MTALLIAGLPGAGKSPFCRWLALKHDFVYIETDRLFGQDGVVDALAADDLEMVVAAARKLKESGPKVTLEWGFRPTFLRQVRAVIGEGFDPWWFGGDELAARQSYTRRVHDAPSAMRAFEVQLAAIHEAWLDIEGVFDGRMLHVISAGPTYMQTEEIYRTIVQS